MAQCEQCGRQMPAFSFKKICPWCVQHEKFQRGELPEETMQPVMTVPWAKRESGQSIVTYALLAINAAVFVGMALAGSSLSNPTSAELLHWGANWGPRTLNGEWWRLFTCMFVHIGLLHIGLNMWCLWDLGALAEMLYGGWTFAIVYVLCGLAGSVASVAWHPATVSAGASGAIFGIAGALIASFYLGEFSLPRAAIQPTLRSVVMFAGYNLVFGAISSRVDNSAHIGGLVCGLILGALIAKAAPDREQPIKRVVVMSILAIAIWGGAVWTKSVRAYGVQTQYAMMLLGQNKPADAVRALKAAVQQKPSDLRTRLWLAYAYEKNSQPVEAEAELKQVIALDPKDASAYYELGRLYTGQKRFDEARNAYQQILPIDASDAHFGLGYLAAAQNNHQLAVDEYQQAARLDPKTEGVHYNLGLSLSELHRYDEAIAAFKQEQEVTGDDADIESELAKAYEAKGMKEAADQARQKVEALKNSGDNNSE